MNINDQNHRAILKSIAHRAMLEQGLFPDLSSAAPTKQGPLGIREMQNLLWASIDNNELRDLDQLTIAEAMLGGKVKIMVPVMDVNSSMINGSAIDQHARNNTASVHTAAEIFSLLSKQVSTDMTFLDFNEDRLSFAAEVLASVEGSLEDPKIYKAWIHNCAKLAYNNLADWVALGIGHSLRPAALIAVSLGRFIVYCFIILGVWLMISGNFGNGLWIAFIGLFVELIKEFIWNKIK